MKTQKTKICYGVMTIVMVLCLIVCADTSLAQVAVETAFTYQGRFSDPNLVPNGRYDLRFELYDDPNEGNLIGVPIELSDIEVADSRFTVELDFGSGALDDATRWLAIGVRSSGTTEEYAFLGPREILSPDPTNGFGLTGNSIYGQADGYYGKGVWGRATGFSGIGVYGEATNTGNSYNCGGYFVAYGDNGQACFGRSYGWNGIGVVGKCEGYSGIGVWGHGKQYDFYAAGPGSNYGSASSIRWKTDIRCIDEPLDKVMKLRGVYYTWDSDHGGQHDVGMIAEEVGKVMPEIVAYEENGIDASGMDYSKMTPLLVEAIKALKSQVDELSRLSNQKSQEIAELKIKLSGLQSLQRENTEICCRLDTLETAAMTGRFPLQKVD